MRDAEREAYQVEDETIKLRLVVDSLKIPDHKQEFNLKKLSIELDKLQKIMDLKHKSDQNTIKMRIKQLDVKEKQNQTIKNDIEHMEKLNSVAINECLLYLEKVKESQNRRMATMMEMIDDNVHIEDMRKKKHSPEVFSTTGERFQTRDSSFTDLLNNYDPDVRAMLEHSIGGNKKTASKSPKIELSSNKKEVTDPATTVMSMRSEVKRINMAVKESQNDSADFESIDQDDEPPGQPNQYPTKGQDYLRKKAKV